MSKIDTYKCDGCGVLKGANNHWWLVTVEPGDLQIFAWNEDRARYVGDAWRHLCGRECVQKYVEKFMEGYANESSGDQAADRRTAGVDEAGAERNTGAAGA